jgi:hypothetical protein
MADVKQENNVYKQKNVALSLSFDSWILIITNLINLLRLNALKNHLFNQLADGVKSGECDSKFIRCKKALVSWK